MDQYALPQGWFIWFYDAGSDTLADVAVSGYFDHPFGIVRQKELVAVTAIDGKAIFQRDGTLVKIADVVSFY